MDRRQHRAPGYVPRATGQDETTTELDGSGDEANATGPGSEADGDEASTDDEVATFCAEFAALDDEAEAVFAGGTPDPDEVRDLVARLGPAAAPRVVASHRVSKPAVHA